MVVLYLIFNQTDDISYNGGHNQVYEQLDTLN